MLPTFLSAILVRVARPYSTETRELFTSTRHSSVPYALGKVGEPGMVLKDAIHHVHNGKTVFVSLHMTRLNFLWGLAVCIVLRIHFRKAETAYHHFEAMDRVMMLESYILPNIWCVISAYVSQ